MIKKSTKLYRNPKLKAGNKKPAQASSSNNAMTKTCPTCGGTGKC